MLHPDGAVLPAPITSLSKAAAARLAAVGNDRQMNEIVYLSVNSMRVADCDWIESHELAHGTRSLRLAR